MFKALPRFGDVLLSLALVVSMFALIGVAQFQGVYHELEYPDQNFDSFFNGATFTEGWRIIQSDFRC